MSLTVVIATRGRPQLLGMTIERVLDNAVLSDTRLMVACDDDDEETIETAYDFDVTVSIEPREDTVGAKWNRAIGVCPADAYYPMVDHSPVVTFGFDKLIYDALAKFEDGYGYLGGPLANPYFPSAQIVTHKLVKALGDGIYPEYFPYWFVDHWLHDIAQMIGRNGYVPIEIDVSQRPQRTMELRDLYFWASLYDVLAVNRHTICRCIFAHSDFATPKWLMEILKQGWPQIDRRSFMINQACRLHARQMEFERGTDAPPDERYLRLKAKAQDLIDKYYHQLKAA